MKVVRLTSVRTKAVDVLGLQWVDREKASAFGLGALPSDKNTVRLYNYNSIYLTACLIKSVESGQFMFYEVYSTSVVYVCIEK